MPDAQCMYRFIRHGARQAKLTKSPKAAGPPSVAMAIARTPVHGGKKATKVHNGLTCNGCGKSFDDKATLTLHKKRSGPQHNVRPECTYNDFDTILGQFWRTS